MPSESGGLDISLCMIVRDEEASLERCLDSVRPYVREMVVVDTGSTDRTREIAREHGALVIDEEWNEDFALARNRGLDFARGKWILVLDADEVVRVPDEERLRRELDDESVEGYLSRVVNVLGDGERDREIGLGLRLFRNRKETRFRGALHEQVAHVIQENRPDARLILGVLEVDHFGYLPHLVRGRRKAERNFAIVRRMADESPEDGFVLFNLGTEYLRLQRWQEALDAFQRASSYVVEGAYWAQKLGKSRIIAHLQLGQYDAALEAIDRQIALYPGYTDLIFLQGVALAGLTRRPEAIGAFHRAIAMGPAPVPPNIAVEERLAGDKADYALGEIYRQIGRPEDAVRHYERAFLAGRDWEIPLRALFSMLFAQEEPDGIGSYLRRLGAGEDAGATEHIASALCDVRRYDLAFAQLEAVRGALAGRGRYLRALCLSKLGRYDEAIAADREVDKKDAEYRRAQVHLAYCLYARGEDAAARRVVRRFKEDPAFRRDVAEHFFSEAREVLQEGLRHFPGSRALEDAMRRLGGRADAS